MKKEICMSRLQTCRELRRGPRDKDAGRIAGQLLLYATQHWAGNRYIKKLSIISRQKQILPAVMQYRYIIY